MEIIFNYKGKKIKVKDVKECKGLAMGKGLMFSRREKAKALLFEFRNPVKFHLTSLFVFFSFIAIWLDDKNNVLEIKKIKSFIPKISSTKTYKKILEIPINETYREVVEILVEDRKI